MKNLFATILTNAAPSSNYRGESELSRTVLQKIKKIGPNNLMYEYPVISSEAIRNAYRELLTKNGLPTNRSRVTNYKKDGKPQLAVKFNEFPNAAKYADDFLFGFLILEDKKTIEENNNLPFKRDSIIRCNIAVALNPYNFDTLFHQSPLNIFPKTKTSSLLHQEIIYTPYQYVIGLNLKDCSEHENGIKWTKSFIESIGELSEVAGGHARSCYYMDPKSIIMRLTNPRVPGYNTYGFIENGNFPELNRISESDLPGDEFWIGGDIVRNMSAEQKEKLKNNKVHLYENPQKLLKDISEEAFVK